MSYKKTPTLLSGYGVIRRRAEKQAETATAPESDLRKKIPEGMLNIAESEGTTIQGSPEVNTDNAEDNAEYHEIIITKQPDPDVVNDPFFDEEARSLLEKIAETEGGEATFERTWEYSRTSIIDFLEQPEYTDKLFQMLLMAEMAKEEKLPEDFLTTFDKLFDKYVIEVFYAIAKGNLEHAGNAIKAVEPFAKDTRIIDTNAFLELTTMYTRALRREEKYSQVAPEKTFESHGPEELAKADDDKKPGIISDYQEQIWKVYEPDVDRLMKEGKYKKAIEMLNDFEVIAELNRKDLPPAVITYKSRAEELCASTDTKIDAERKRYSQ